ncbi:MAG: pitrilysin family protein [Thermoguttaceae bacterium]
MKRRVPWHFVLAAIVALGFVHAVPAAEQPLEPLHYDRVQPLADGVTLAKLSNGLTVIVQENHAAPVATVRCFVKNTGSAYEGKNLGAGLSHVLEHVVAGGTTKHRTEKEIQRIIGRFGGVTNASTSTDLTIYYIDCPAKNTMTAVELIADAMQHVAFAPAEFERELKVVRRELADGEVNRGRVLAMLLQQTVYATHPARCPVIGYLDVLKQTTNQAIIDFYRERYVPNNQVFVVVGDVDARQVMDKVAEQYQGTPRGRQTYVPFEKEPPQVAPREAVREMDGATYDLALVWPTVKLSSPDLYALDVAAYILGEGESSRLVERLRNQQRLVLYVGAASDTPHFVNGLFGVTAVCTPATWRKAVDAAVAEVYRLRDELVAHDELAKAKKQKAAEMVLARQTVQSAADGLGRNYIATADPLFDKTYVEGIQRVTAEQIRDVARRYFVPERLSRIIIAPPGGAPKPAENAGKQTEGDVRLVRLANGLRVLLKRDSHLPLVNLQAFVVAGSLADDEKTAGRSALVAAMLDRGTADRSAQKIADYFDAIGAQMSIEAGRFTIHGNLTTLRDEFPAAAELFAECFLRPTFPEPEFAKVRQLALGAIAARAGNPQQKIGELFADTLPATTPYHLVQGGKASTVKTLTVQDLQAYHTRYFVPNNMVVTVFGDIDPEMALALVEKQFGRLKPNPDFQPPKFNQPNAIPKTIVRHMTLAQETGIVRFGYPTASIFDKNDYAAMTLLDAIMSGYNSPSGWLFEELRGAGLVYAVDAAQMTGPVPGYFVIVAQTRPAKVNEVVTRIEKNVERAKAGKITKDEFRTAVAMILAMHAQENTTLADQAREAAVDELYGLGYDYRKSFDARMRAIRLEDVVAAAQKYLGNHILVTGAPETN